MIRSEKRKSEKKEDAGARKGRKAAMNCVLAPEGRKVDSPTAADAEPSGQIRDEDLHAVMAKVKI